MTTQFAQYVTPEQALKQAEQYQLEDNPDDAIEALNSAL